MPLATVVLDTNVFVAAGFNPRSASARIVEAVKQGQVRMVWNDATRRELEHILQKIPSLRAHPVAELFRPGDRFTAATHPERFAFIPDPDDRKFAALAQAAGATLVSNDEHLLRAKGTPVGCGGIKLVGSEYGEIKRMYVRPQFRRLGFGKLMLDHLADYARSQDISLLRLETGIQQQEAIGSYERMGFYRIPPFGPYADDPLSRCYEKRLT